MEPSIINGTTTIPMSYKDYGKLEARMITLVNERLARYPNAYGVSFTSAPSLDYRLKMLGSIMRPARFRRLAYRVQNRRAQDLPVFLQENYLGRVMDCSMPRMRRYFIPERIADDEVYNRVATMEYLCERYGVD